MRKFVFGLALVCAACGDSASEGGTTAQPKSPKTASPATAAPKSSAAPSASASAAAAPPATASAAPSASAAANVSVAPTQIAPKSIGVAMALKSGAMEGSSYKAMAEVTNKTSKEISGVTWKTCTYEADGKLRNGNVTNGGNVTVKAGGKGDLEVFVDPAPIVGFVITGYTAAGAPQSAPFGEDSCPDTVKP
jgi:hypothetical protein